VRYIECSYKFLHSFGSVQAFNIDTPDYTVNHPAVLIVILTQQVAKN